MKVLELLRAVYDVCCVAQSSLRNQQLLLLSDAHAMNGLVNLSVAEFDAIIQVIQSTIRVVAYKLSHL